MIVITVLGLDMNRQSHKKVNYTCRSQPIKNQAVYTLKNINKVTKMLVFEPTVMCNKGSTFMYVGVHVTII
jgi:hypothetical protein